MFQGVSRAAVSVSRTDLVTLRPFPAADGDYTGNGTFLRIAEPTTRIDLAQWIAQNGGVVEKTLIEHGGILCRGFEVHTADALRGVALASVDALLPYTERTAPRTELAPNVYTSTTHPKEQVIHFHNANSYSMKWPLKIWFGCLTEPDYLGRTPIADCRQMMSLLHADVLDEFRRKGVSYQRNFHPGIGLPWQEVFSTTDPAAVEAYGRENHIEVTFSNSERLRITQRRWATQAHPVTGDEVWFSQAHLFHVASLESTVQETLRGSYAERDLPRHAYFGDGTTIPEATVAHIIECYERASASFAWRRGDVLLLDNMRIAHARTPFSGRRLVAVCFARLHRSEREIPPGELR